MSRLREAAVELPAVMLAQPRDVPGSRAVWSGRFEGGVVEALFDSAFRAEIAAAILDGAAGGMDSAGIGGCGGR